MINIFMGGTNMKATGIVRPVDPLESSDSGGTQKNVRDQDR